MHRLEIAFLGIFACAVAGLVAWVEHGIISCGSPEMRMNVDSKSLQSSLDMFKVDYGRYPTNTEGLKALIVLPRNLSPSKSWKPLDPRSIQDFWGHNYRYSIRKQGGVFRIILRSSGADPADPGDDVEVALQ